MIVFHFPTDDAIAAKALMDGKLIAFPTETVFGIGCRYDSKAAFDDLIRVKRRPATKPFTMMLGDPASIAEYAEVNARQQRIIDAFMPGEITVILKKKPIVPDYVTLNGPTIGIRIPAHQGLLGLLKACPEPLLVPSCNRSGETPCSDVDQIQSIFHDDLYGVFDGKKGDSVPSTVVLLTGDEPKILRQGKITADAILSVWNRK